MLPSKFRFLSHTRARLFVEGPDAKRFLHGMVTNDVLGLKEGQGCHAAMLTVKGKLLGDFVIYQVSENSLLLSMETSIKESIFTALQRHLIMDDATVHDQSDTLGQMGIYGNDVVHTLNRLFGLDHSQLMLQPSHFIQIQSSPSSSENIRIAKTLELGIPGYFLFASHRVLEDLMPGLLSQTALELLEEEAEMLRIEAGIPRYGYDMDEDRLPLEANLADAINFQKGCYLGQEVIVRVTARGHINRKLVGLSFPAGGEPPAKGSNLFHATRENAGTVMSGTRWSKFGTIALGYVHRTLWEPGTQLYVAERGATVSESTTKAVVHSLPFEEQAHG